MIVYIQEEVELHLFVSVDLAIEDARAISRALRLYGMRAPFRPKLLSAKGKA